MNISYRVFQPKFKDPIVDCNDTEIGDLTAFVNLMRIRFGTTARIEITIYPKDKFDDEIT